MTGGVVVPDSIVWQRFEAGHYEGECKDLIALHARETHSEFSQKLLDNWDLERGKFWHVVPKEMLTRLKHPLKDAA